jgi:hypothetical protein
MQECVNRGGLSTAARHSNDHNGCSVLTAGKRTGKARGSKGGTGKAAAKGEVGGPEAQQRKAARGKKGAAAVEEVVGPTAKKPTKKKSWLKRLSKHWLFWPVIVALCVVAFVIYSFRSRAKAEV